ncbi:hypothetical protein Lesp02_41200 [Lentzea sp. NBRC 105346]|uniref:hypothetical protein n=1 Tax=Lentzea sp. NBRC 105346 TaxID=3032205 RepID=UPI0024A2C434|nr:hypothetical protein [Lentzea sp. NBRC 105346]GLZ31932.1 hypothetical protein Lesp02_41200 [Lentzea sp. NBRC 105346]
MNYRISPEEMEAHSKKLSDVGDRVNTALGAGEASSHPEAFGLLGIPLMGICSAAQFMAMNVLRDAAEAALDHVKRVDAWREDVKNNEETQTAVFDGMYNE